jgi:hypothetical protein
MSTMFRIYNGEARIATAVLMKDGTQVLQVYPTKTKMAYMGAWMTSIQEAYPGVNLEMRYRIQPPKPKDTPEVAQIRALYKRFGMKNSLTYYAVTQEDKARWTDLKIYTIKGHECALVWGDLDRQRLYVWHQGEKYRIYFNKDTGQIKCTNNVNHYDGLPPSDGTERRFYLARYRYGRRIHEETLMQPKV